MFIYISFLFLLLTPLVMLIIRLARPGFVYQWLVAVAGAMIAWSLVILAGLRLPQSLALFNWGPAFLDPTSPLLLVDQISWPYAVGVATLALAVILTDVARATEADWTSWADSLSIAAFGLVAVFAGDPLTLLLAWTAIDLFELLILLRQVHEAQARQDVVIAFSARVFGSYFLIAAGIINSQTAGALTFSVNSPQAVFLWILAAGLRLGVLPFHLPFLQEPPLRRGLGTMTRLVPAAAALAFLARTAFVLESTTMTTLLSTVLLVLAGLTALYASFSWLTAANELEGRPVWILGMASFSLASAVRAQPEASLAWGIAALLAGGQLFITSTRDRWLTWLTMIGFVSISAVPFSPSWNGAGLFSGPFLPVLALFWLAHVLFLIGYARHALRTVGSLAGVERWVWLIYPLGILLLAGVSYALGWWAQPDLSEVPLVFWIEGPLALAVSVIVLVWARQRDLHLQVSSALLQAIFSLRWLYAFLREIYQALQRLVYFITTILEGEGGILWVLIWTTILLAMWELR